MTQDLNKGISSIAYNNLHLPRTVDIKNKSTEGRNEYTYSATGQKLRAVQRWNPTYNTNPILGSDVNVASMSSSVTTDYVGNKIYENNVLKRILVDGGYYESGNYYFYITDHLGNNRIVANAAASVVQSTQYYPFGSSFADGMETNTQPYKYNGKELDTRNGLNMYDYSARWKSDWSFSTMDPLAELEYAWSPYAYVVNNPLRWIDPSGMKKGDPDDPIELPELVVRPTPTENPNGIWFGFGQDLYSWGAMTDQPFMTNNGSHGGFIPLSDKMNISNSEGFYTSGKVTSFFGAIGSAYELKQGAFRLTNGVSNGSQISLKYYASGWRGGSRAQISTYKLSKVGSVVGGFTFGLSTATDVYGFYNNVVSPEKVTFNFAMGVSALVSPAFGVPYGLSEAFVPGGFATVIGAYAESQRTHLEMAHKYWWYPIPIIH